MSRGLDDRSAHGVSVALKKFSSSNSMYFFGWGRVVVGAPPPLSNCSVGIQPPPSMAKFSNLGVWAMVNIFIYLVK